MKVELRIDPGCSGVSVVINAPALTDEVKALAARLDRHTFVRISHSEIISLRKITALDLSLTGTIRVTLEGGAVSYVSRRYVRKIKEALGL